MKNSKKIMSIVAGVVMASQLLTVSNIATFAEINDVANTSTEIENPALSENEITLSGVGYTSGVQSFKLKFDTEHHKLKAEDLAVPNNAMHVYFGNNKYIELELISQDGEVKDTFSMTGNDKVDKVKQINAEDRFNFEYGDRLVIHHAEADWRTKISGNVISNNNSRAVNDFDERVSKEVLNNNSFEITRAGLKEVANEDSITVEGLDCQGGTHAFKILFDHLNRRLKVKSVAGKNCPIEPYHQNAEYVTLQVVNEQGAEVDSVTLTGNDHVSKAEELNGCKFKAGYGLRILHDDAGSHIKVTGDIEDATPDEFNEIDKDLLERITFREGKDGLYCQETPKYPDEITLKGVGCEEGLHQFKIGFNKRDMQMKISDVVGLGSSGHHGFHQFFGDNEYLELALYDKRGREKASVTLTGNSNVSKVIQVFNNRTFEYGDYLKIYHAEGYKRFQVSHTSRNARNITSRSITELPKGEHVYKIGDGRLINMY